MMRVRPPAVAGSFYPADPGQLRDMVDRYVADVAVDEVAGPAPTAVIAPHAGYTYSGSTAGVAYAALARGRADLKHVVLVGPCHYVGIRGVALPDAQALATPLGEVPVWAEGAAIAAHCPGVVESAAAHAPEHSLEVHLPFLQRALPEVDVVPLAVGLIDPVQVGAILDALWGDGDTAIIISSDLSHYRPYREAVDVDAATVTAILAGRGPIDHDQACGATGINGLLVVAPRHHLTGHVVAACNSGDTAGDKRRVVGYASLTFSEDGRA